MSVSTVSSVSSPPQAPPEAKARRRRENFWCFDLILASPTLRHAPSTLHERPHTTLQKDQPSTQQEQHLTAVPYNPHGTRHDGMWRERSDSDRIYRRQGPWRVYPWEPEKAETDAVPTRLTIFRTGMNRRVPTHVHTHHSTNQKPNKNTNR